MIVAQNSLDNRKQRSILVTRPRRVACLAGPEGNAIARTQGVFILRTEDSLLR